MTDLYPYQEDAIARISTRASYLAFDMGLGKSAVALKVAKKRNVSRLLILCNAIGRLSWVKECKRWWPEMPVLVVTKPADLMVHRTENIILIVAYSSLSMSKSGGFDYVAALQQWRSFDMTVLDEAHALKNPGAIRTKAVLVTLRKMLGFCLPMSGTPVPNHPGELFPILRTLFPETVKNGAGIPMKQYEFENIYCEVSSRRFNGRDVRVIEGGKNLDVLKAKLKPYMIRLTKKQALPQLPDMAFDTYPVDAPNAPDWGLYWRRMSDDELEAAMLRGGGDEHLMKQRRLLGEAKVPGAVEAVSDMLDNCKRKVLVFAHHHSVIDGLVKGLAGYGLVKLDGRDGATQRQHSIEAFLTNPGIRVLVGQIQAAGTSITLVGPGMEVSDVFFVEADFSPGNNVQAASRIHRIGQKDAVQVWFLTAAGTYDERIEEILARKAADFQKLFG